MKKRDSFVLYTSQRDAVQALSDHDAGRLFKAIYSYQLGEGDPELDPMPNLVFLMMRPIFDRDALKWEETARKRAEAGAKGGRAKAGNASGGEQDKPEPSDATSDKQEQAESSNAKQSQAPLSNAKQTQAELDAAKQSQANQAVIGIGIVTGIEIGSDSSNTNSASGDAPRTHDSTQKPVPKPKAVLEGKRLESFERFWNAFGYKKGRGGAEKAWAAIPSLTDNLVDQICEAARKEAAQRSALEAQGRTPKWAQGWLNERRWEDDYEATQPQMQVRPAFQPHGQQKTWAEISDEKMKQDCLKGMYDYMDMMGIPHEENDNADEQPRDQWTAEVIND
jgi:hypothetical protein